MKFTSLLALLGIGFSGGLPFAAWAGIMTMQNGDRYSGQVLSVSAASVELQSPDAGKNTAARSNVASLTFGTNAVAPKFASPLPVVAAPTNPPGVDSRPETVKPDAELAAMLRLPAVQTNSLRQIREQMLASAPKAVGKFNELVGGLMTGKLNVEDIRREARSAVNQLRELKRELGPEVSGSLDGYLSILEKFLQETPAGGKTNAPVR